MPSAKSRRLIKQASFALAIAGLISLVLFVRSLVADARRSAERLACIGHLTQLASFLNSYYQANGSLPPAYVADEKGRLMHSWRVLITPYTSNNSLLVYDLNKAWNDPKNSEYIDESGAGCAYYDASGRHANKKELGEFLYGGYACPSDKNALDRGLTNYVAIVGANTLWPGKSGCKPKTGFVFSLAENTFGAKESISPASVDEKDKILLIELPNSDIQWLEPRDITVEQAIELYRERKRGRYSSCRTHLHYITLSGKNGDISSIPDEETFRNMCGTNAPNSTKPPSTTQSTE